MQKVIKTDTCWNWTGSQSGSGYGQFWNGERNIPAHHFLLAMKPQNEQQACHKCDNKLCVNPDHIFIGSRSDNEQDKIAKGRHNTAPGAYAMLAVRNQHGNRNPQSKLTDEQVAEIKTTPRVRGSGRQLAAKFSVTEACINAIRQGVNRA